MSRSTDNRSNLARGFDWATRISTACLMMVLPCVGGFYIDNWLGTTPLFLLLLLALGMGLGTWQLIRIAQKSMSDSFDQNQNTKGDDRPPSE